MLTLHRGVPADYRALLPFLVTPTIWAQKGSIPGLVALLRAFLARDAPAMIEANQHISVLGIVQQRLIPSKANDGWGFELLQSVVLHIPLWVTCGSSLPFMLWRLWLNVCVLQEYPSAIFPSDYRDVAHPNAAKQDE
jgi:CAS/CSE protein, C-terminus